MPAKNKYINRSRISEAKFREVTKYFSLDLDAQKIALLTRLNRNTVNRYVSLFRKRIAEICETETPFKSIIEVDESYFGAKRIRGKRGRGAAGKIPVFGILQRRGKVSPDSVIHSDGWRGYNGLVDIGYKKHYRIHHGANQFARGKKHINGIESFWAFAKTRLSKFNGLSRNSFYLHLKECEFRFNHRDQDLYLLLLKMFREKPLN